MMQMSDFFSGLTNGNIARPESKFNMGPLPTNTYNGPPGSRGDPDGRINFNSSLLSGIKPYAYAESARMGSDKNYQQIPHRMAKIIPQLYLPGPVEKDSVGRDNRRIVVSHSVDMGDVAFAISVVPQHVVPLLSPATFVVTNSTTDPLFSFTPFCNFITANYILAGLQRWGSSAPPEGQVSTSRPWHELYKAFGYQQNGVYKIDTKKEVEDEEGKKITILNYEECLPEVLRVVRTHLIPFGICAGSEEQGGQHEKSLLPVQAAVNHVTTMTLDGQNRDLVNYWRQEKLHAGDTLTFQLRLVETQNYTLNHYYKAQSQACFPTKMKVWQLVPVVLDPVPRWMHVTFQEQAILKEKGMDAGDRDAMNPRLKGIMQRDFESFDKGYCADRGYWRIGQMMHFRGAQCPQANFDHNDAMNFLSGGLLQITFAPVWVQHVEMGDKIEMKDVDDDDDEFEWSWTGLAGPRGIEDLKRETAELMWIAYGQAKDNSSVDMVQNLDGNQATLKRKIRQVSKLIPAEVRTNMRGLVGEPYKNVLLGLGLYKYVLDLTDKIDQAYEQQREDVKAALSEWHAVQQAIQNPSASASTLSLPDMNTADISKYKDIAFKKVVGEWILTYAPRIGRSADLDSDQQKKLQSLLTFIMQGLDSIGDKEFAYIHTDELNETHVMWKRKPLVVSMSELQKLLKRDDAHRSSSPDSMDEAIMKLPPSFNDLARSRLNPRQAAPGSGSEQNTALAQLFAASEARAAASGPASEPASAAAGVPTAVSAAVPAAAPARAATNTKQSSASSASSASPAAPTQAKQAAAAQLSSMLSAAQGSRAGKNAGKRKSAASADAE